MEKSKKGEAGYVHTQAAKFAVLTYLFRFLENLQAEEHTRLRTVLKELYLTPMAHHTHFPANGAEDIEPEVDDALESKLGAQMSDLFHLIYAGEHDVELKGLGGSQNPWAILSVAQSTAQQRGDTEEVKIPHLAAAIKDVLHLASSVTH